MKQNRQKTTNQDHKCSICMIRNQNSRLPQCNHKFCFTCINRWSKVRLYFIQKNNTCPHCRTKFSSIITKQKFRKNSKIIKQGRLISPPKDTINIPNQVQTVETTQVQMVYQPTLCFLPIACFSFPYFQLQYPPMGLYSTTV